MKKWVLSLTLIFSFTAYVLYKSIGGFDSNVNYIADNIPNQTPIQTLTTIPIITPRNNLINTFFGDEGGGEGNDDGPRLMPRQTTPNPVTIPASVTPPVFTTPVISVKSVTSGMYKDGTYTGSNEYAYSDYIQVSAVISGGKLTDVQFPSQSNGPGRSRQIYAYAMPQLRSEAISAQSANINGISGASYTSQAFQQSLANALVQAKN